MENMGTGSAKRGRKPKALMPSPVAMTDLRTVNQLPPGRPQADNGDEEDNDEAEYFENDDN